MAFFSLLLSARGLNPSQVSLVLGLALLARVAVGPVWGAIGDRLGRIRPVLAVASIVACGSVLTILEAHGFWMILTLVMLYGTGASALMPLSDTLTLAASRRLAFDFGRVRAAGSGAFMLAAVGSGFAIASFGTGIIAWLMAAGHAATVLLLPIIPEARRPAQVIVAHAPRPWSIPAFRLLLVSSALIQGAHAAYYALSTLHWRAAGISDRVIGVLWAEGVLAEIIVMLALRGLALRLGPARLIAIGAVGSVIRWTGTALTTDPWALACLQPLHAASFALQYLASIQIITHCVSADRAGMAQSLNAAIGVAAPLGAIMWLAGVLYDGIGGLVFLPMTVIAGSALLLVPRLGRAVAWDRSPTSS